MVQSLNDYLKSAQGLPETVQKLQSEAGIKLVLTNLDDPDALGCFVQYRVAFYVAGEIESLTNAFMLLDGHLQFKNKQLVLKEKNYSPPVGVAVCCTQIQPPRESNSFQGASDAL